MVEGQPVQRILLVDDSETVLVAWSLTCSRIGKEAFCATNRHDAIEQLHHKPDLVVVDLFLEDDTGIEVIRDVRTRSKAFVILVSAHLCVDYAMLGVQAGANDCYDKTVSVVDLVKRVELGRRAEPDWQKVPSLKEVEWQHIARVLNDCNGNISHAADVLGEHRQSLQRKIQRHAPGALRVGGHRARRPSNKLGEL